MPEVLPALSEIERVLRLLDGHTVHVIDLLSSRRAPAGFEAAVRDLPEELRGRRPEGLAHTPWQLLEHLRIAQWDILEFCRGSEHESPAWPEGYCPVDEAPPAEAAWEESLAAFRRDLRAMRDLVADPATDRDAVGWWLRETTTDERGGARRRRVFLEPSRAE